MHWWQKWMGRGDAAAPSGHTSLSSGHSKVGKGGPPSAPRPRELLATALRDVLARNGIPAGWITAEMLSATSRTGVKGVHLRLVIRHWDPRLQLRLVPLQNALVVRLHGLDPIAEEWLLGISWQLALPDESVCPPLPHPGSWTADAAQPRAPATPAATGGGVIEGPVRVNARGDLERLLSEMDGTYRERAADPYQATEPTHLKTQPGSLREP